jgi:hypothetical protein
MLMKPIVKATVALGLGAALMASVVDTSFARNRWVGPAVGFGVGVAVGAAAANAYNDPYYNGYNDPYGRSYAAGPYYGRYNDPYGGAYAAGPGYAYPSPGPYYRNNRECTAENLGRPGC